MPFPLPGLGAISRRYCVVDDFMGALMPLHKFLQSAASCTGAAATHFISTDLQSLYTGVPAPENPWNGKPTLEWIFLRLHLGIISGKTSDLTTLSVVREGFEGDYITCGFAPTRRGTEGMETDSGGALESPPPWPPRESGNTC